MRLWPAKRTERRRALLLWCVLIGVAAFALFRLKSRFGWGQGDLTPVISAVVPSDTPLPLATAASAELASEWNKRTVGERAREALWLTPPGAGSRPLVIVMHGDGGTARTFHEQFTYEEASGTWATLVYPEGIGRGWDTESPEGNKDIAYLDALIDEAVASRHVDAERVFLTGYSSGGFLAQLYACQRSSRVRGIATHEAGAPYGQSEKWSNGSSKCPGQGPVATLVTHGRDDLSVGFKSGLYSAYYWAGVNGCDVKHAHATAYSQCYAYAECAPGKPALFCDIPGLGHWVWSEGAVASVRFFQRLLE